MLYIVVVAYVVLVIASSVCFFSNMHTEMKEKVIIAEKIKEIRNKIDNIKEIQNKIDNMPKAVLKAFKDIKHSENTNT
jgi:peptidoglycan hydrolase CwlO-like protein